MDHSLGLWDVKNRKLVRILENIVDYPYQVYFVADDSLILIYSTDHRDESEYLSAVTELGEKKYSISMDDCRGYCICGSGKNILVGFMTSNVVNLYDMRTGKIIEEIVIQDCRISGVCAFPEYTYPSGKHILVIIIVLRDEILQNTSYRASNPAAEKALPHYLILKQAEDLNSLYFVYRCLMLQNFFLLSILVKG